MKKVVTLNIIFICLFVFLSSINPMASFAEDKTLRQYGTSVAESEVKDYDDFLAEMQEILDTFK